MRKWTVSADLQWICPENFLLRKSGGKACILRSERIVMISKKSMFDFLYSYTHLVHSFVAETHCKLYPLIIFRSDDLRRRKRSLKNVVSIENEYSEILVSVGKCLFELYLSSMLLNKPPDDTVIRAQSTSTIIL